MDIAKSPEKGDAIIKKTGIKVFIEREADKFLSEATMDFSDDQGFIISGMQHTSCCG